MLLLKILTVFATSLMLMSCASLPMPVKEPTSPLPAALATACPPIAGPENNTAESVAVALKLAYDQYGLCAGRFIELLNYLEQQNGRY